MTLTPLAGGLRIVSGEVSGGVLSAGSSFLVHIGNIERLIKPLVISNDAGYVVEIAECSWLEKPGIAYGGGPNDLTVVVRQNPGVVGPHTLVPAYEDLSDVEFQIVAIVH